METSCPRIKLLKGITLLFCLLLAMPVQAAGTWSTLAPMPTPRCYVFAEAIGGKLYVSTGAPGWGGATTATESYDPATNLWTTRAPAPTAVAYAVSGVIDGKMYLADGCIGGDCRIGTTNLLNVYDPGTNVWTALPSAPTARAAAAGTAAGGKLYVVGGNNGTVGNPPQFAPMEEYDPSLNTWSSKAPIPTLRDLPGAVEINGKIYVIGGFRRTLSSAPWGEFTGALEVYDPATNTWTTKTPMPTPREMPAVGVINGQIHVVGGSNALFPYYHNVHEVYDPATDTWTTETPMPTPRTGSSADVIDGRLYIAGGNTLSGITNILEVFTPERINLALTGTATQSSVWPLVEPSRAIDGNTDGNWSNGSVSHTNSLGAGNQWWQVDLRGMFHLTQIVLWNRTDAVSDRLSNFNVSVLDNRNNTVWTHDYFTGGGYPNPSFTIDLPANTFGQVVKVRLYADNFLSLAEVQVFGDGTPPPAQTPPVANAGSGQTVHVGRTVILDGSSSTDSGGLTLAYQWNFVSKPAGSGASLSDPTIANPTFTPDSPGAYVLRLIVTNSSGVPSSASTVTISTTNAPPEADAGPDQSITIIGTNVLLNGVQSYDPDGDTISYGWTLSPPPGSITSLIGANTATPTFISDVHGTYVAQLVVSDAWASSALDTVTISFENVKPVANAQQSQSIPVGTVAFVGGSGSSDANHDPLTYKWTLISLPTNSQSTIFNPTASNTSFIPNLPGTYIAQLIVNDGFVDSDPSTVQIQSYATESAAIASATDIQASVSLIPALALKNANMMKTLNNKLNAAIASIDAGLYADALDQLKNDILNKTDGCAITGAPDKNDWITTCQEQNQIYPLIQETIWIIEGLLP